MIAEVTFMLQLLGSSTFETNTTSESPMTVEKIAQIAIDLTGATDTWQSDEIMDEIYGNKSFVKWAMGLNLHNSRIIKKKISRNKYEIVDQGEDQCEADSSSEDNGKDIDLEATHNCTGIMQQKVVKRAIPRHFLIKPRGMTDEIYLYDLIGKMTPEMFAEFFQSCYDIIHNNNFALILFDTIIKRAGKNPIEYYSLLDKYDAHSQRMIDTITLPLIADAVKNLLAWVREEDLLKRHVEVGIGMRSLGLTIVSCDSKDIQRILNQLEYKLGTNIQFPNLWLWNVDFSQDESPFSHIHHRILHYLTKVRFDSCIFKNGVFSIIKRESTNRKALTADEYRFLERIEQLRINGCGIRGIDDSLKLLTELRMFNLRGFEFEDVPAPIYQMKKLTTLKLRTGNLYDITDDIRNLTELETFALSQNKFKSIPVPVTKMGSIVELAIGWNRITKISNTMENMKNLSTLILENNSINADHCCEDLGLPRLRILSMKNCMLNKLPKFVQSLTGLKELICSKNMIAVLDNKLHTYLKELEALVIPLNSFTRIPITICSMKKLQVLVIGCNIPNRTMNIDTFDPPTGLIRLGLQSCESNKGIPDWIFKLDRLSKLTMTDCNIVTVPSEIAKLKNLTIVKLLKCNFSKFPEELIKLSELRLLHLGRNPGIKTIPPSISRLKKLEKLIMYECGLIGKLSTELCELLKLEYLNISSNFITEIPPEIENLKMVKTLDAHGNPNMMKLPASIGNMHSLTILKVSDCDLEGIPETIGNLKFLEGLDIGMNKRVMKLPETIGCLSRLWKLNCNGMGLTTTIQRSQATFRNIDNRFTVEKPIPDTFFDLHALHEVDFSCNNKLRTISNLLVKLRCLNVLDMCKCGLNVLPSAIYNLPQLRDLKVGLNGISNISENIGNLKRLKVLRFYLNGLKSLPSSLRELHRLEVLDLKPNKFPYSYRNDLVKLGEYLSMYSLKIYIWSTDLPKNTNDYRQVIDDWKPKKSRPHGKYVE